ncbi:MAG: HAMP domain-containing histidine kinase [Thermoleophilia bacterium]|nr:HAMP domain-containing histidine kinase [Thermoleophilia bacterium]
MYFGGTVTLALVAAFAVFWFSWSAYAVAQRTDDLTPRVVALARAQDIATVGLGAAALRERLFRVEARLIGAQLFVVDEAGVVLRSSADTSLTVLPVGRLGEPDAGGVRAGSLSTAGAAGTLLLVAAPMDGGETLVAVQALKEVRDAQRGILTVAFATVLAGIAVAWVAGGLLARRLTAPLRRLEAAAERVAAGEWGAQVAEEGDAETASLARSFNHMSTRVAAAYEAQKDFIGDVSHEIRTPLTSIRGFTEALLDGTVADPAQRERALGAIKEESIRLTEMAQTLLALAELDAGAVEIQSTPVDVDQVADALRGRFGAAAEARGIHLSIDLASPVAPVADSDRLIQAASALVANAVAYPPPGSEVRVHASVEGGSWLLLVDDSGPGIPRADRERLFERFARLDSSRSSASGGTGLGLSICRRLVALMGGSVGVSDSPSGGARFTIELPSVRVTQRKLNTEST